MVVRYWLNICLRSQSPHHEFDHILPEVVSSRDSHPSVNALTSVVLSPCVPSYEGTPVYRGTKDCHRESPLESVIGQGPGHRCKHLMLASLPDRMNTPIQQLQFAGCQENMLAGRGAQETLKGGLIWGCYGF